MNRCDLSGWGLSAMKWKGQTQRELILHRQQSVTGMVLIFNWKKSYLDHIKKCDRIDYVLTSTVLR